MKKVKWGPSSRAMYGKSMSKKKMIEQFYMALIKTASIELT